MFNWFKRKSTTVYRLLEVSKVAPLPSMTPELKESLRALQLHPGFQYMLQRLDLERANLKKYLEEGFKLNESELHHLQAGVYYTGWLRRETDRLTSVPRISEAVLEPTDQELFNELQSQLEIVR